MNSIDKEQLKALIRETLEEIQREKDNTRYANSLAANIEMKYASLPREKVDEAIKRFWAGDGWKDV